MIFPPNENIKCDCMHDNCFHCGRRIIIYGVGIKIEDQVIFKSNILSNDFNYVSLSQQNKTANQ